ncbi:MAG: N-formylglutamate amidohydrolase [Sinobacteraceae bacterium]|nr:N-formylglutamate amidohydrolase [Nevskiaceae bacterium]
MTAQQSSDGALLAADEPPACAITNRYGSSRFLIVVDHASARIPRCLGALGLPIAELTRHIAWDIGALAVAEEVAGLLDAPLIAQNYSRLVIDCNRDPAVDSSIPTLSEYTEIPGNMGLTAAERAARRRALFDPYHDCIRKLLDERQAAGRLTILIAQHTMTNIFRGKARDMHAAVLYNRDRRFAGLMLEGLRADSQLLIADNEPYFVSDATDYTIPHHAEARSLPHVEIELRQDLVTGGEGQREWSRRLATALRSAEQAFLQRYVPLVGGS